ncbi:hypothetical protein NDU88_003065 [Pleurodeles waltl]|uniref:Uncharacterized protein n=1 Tax=Pleurodeles waltl TaxID=8319 RepID=A0AAV7UZJ6_PLEWA|nr:hypothetical protein NDU88_003065 [Pleurodeles waltl]
MRVNSVSSLTQALPQCLAACFASPPASWPRDVLSLAAAMLHTFLTDTAAGRPQFICAHFFSAGISAQVRVQESASPPCNLPRVSTSSPCLNAGRPCNCVTVPAVKHLQWDWSGPGEVRAAVISSICRFRPGYAAQFGCRLLPTAVRCPTLLSRVRLPLPV